MTVKEHTKLDTETIAKLGLTREEFQSMSLTKPSTIEGFINLLPEMVVAKVKEDMTILNLEMVKETPVKKGTYLVVRMLSFIKLFHKGRLLPTHFFKKFYNPYKGEDLNNKSLLVYVYNAGIGDMLFQQAILRHLKIKYPRCFITYAVPNDYIDFVNSWNTVDRVISNIFEVKHLINSDYHLHFEFIIRSSFSKETNIYKNFVDRSFLNISFNQAYPQIPPNPEYIRLWKQELQNKNINEFIIVNFNSSNPMRVPSVDFQNKILDLLKEYTIIFIDSKSKNDQINGLIKNRNNCYNFTDISNNIIQSTSLISLSKLVVSVDTGLAHLAVAVGVPLYGLYSMFPGGIRLSTYPNTNWTTDWECPNKKFNEIGCQEHDKFTCDYWKNGGAECYDNMNLEKIKIDINNLLKN